MKTLFYLLFSGILMFLLSCSKEKTDESAVNEGIYFYTDKSIYQGSEKIVLKFENKTSYGVSRNWCRFYYKERLEDGNWDILGEGPCPGGGYIYIEPNGTLNDTLSSTYLGNGRYRCVTVIKSNKISITVYTNEFVVEGLIH